MLLHNPYRHNVHCPALGEDLAPFETRELTVEQTKRAAACPDCRCQTMEPTPAKPDAKVKA